MSFSFLASNSGCSRSSDVSSASLSCQKCVDAVATLEAQVKEVVLLISRASGSGNKTLLVIFSEQLSDQHDKNLRIHREKIT